MNMRLLTCAGCVLFLAAPLYGSVSMSALFADHMVVQRHQPVHIWGDAAAGESLTVEFRGEQRTTTADPLGRWMVEFPPGEAGGPFVLTVRGANALTFKDILVGDVWIASGQSNMTFELRGARNAQQEMEGANLPQMRLLMVKQRFADYPLENVAVTQPWSACTPDSAAAFSAVAFFFARDLVEREHVPIGIIESAWGWTPAEAWTSMTALSRDASLMPVFSAWAVTAAAEPDTLRMQPEKRAEIAEKLSMPNDENLPVPWLPVFKTWAPGALYNGMIAPLTRFPICGVIWYQGESNADPRRYPVYARLFQTLIQDWRSAWSEGNFPFLFVQIANFHTGPDDHWPDVRVAQLAALALVNTAMTVTIDIGDPRNIHPADKQDVGHRLALAARAIVYGEQVEYSGPIFRSMSRAGDSLRLYFDHADTGLVAGGGTLQGFEVAGPDGKFVPAVASVEDTSVLVSSPAVQDPVQVRYGWSDNPVCNLFNKDGLPASPFRTLSMGRE
jgi:sialate O-acetylesterase